MAGITVVVVLLSPEAILFMGGETYQDAMYLIPPIVYSVFLVFCYGLFSTIEFYYAVTRYIMIASVSGAVLNLFLNALFIPLFGYPAAAYTTAVCYLFFLFMHYFFAKIAVKKERIEENIFCTERIFLLCFLTGIICLTSEILYPLPFIRYGILLIVILMFLLKKNWFLSAIKNMKDIKNGA